jgi:ABC-type dipeptide/oligopeptide/nickel transport system ATPase component
LTGTRDDRPAPPDLGAATAPEILAVDNLKTYFFVQDGIVRAVDGVSFSLAPGEVLGLVGESGSGKSMTCRSIMRIVPPPGRIVAGRILYQGQDILAWPESRLPSYRGSEVSMILQEPMTALNPVLSIGTQIVETIVQHEGDSRGAARDRATELCGWWASPRPSGGWTNTLTSSAAACASGP